MLRPMHYLDGVAERSSDIPFKELIAFRPVLESVRDVRTVCPEVIEASIGAVWRERGPGLRGGS